jgi:thioredoxin reductase (NADPH)
LKKKGRIEVEKVVIVGTGCAGLTAAIYTARANLEPLVIDGRMPGGQLTTTTIVENFPGFPEGIMGFDLTANMRTQAERFGARFLAAEVTGSNLGSTPFILETYEGPIQTRTLIIATGADPRYLGLESEKKLIGHGVSSCATCDGALYRNVPVAVIGGGDSAMEEAIFLTKFASKVYVIHRRDQLRASPIMGDRAMSNEKIEFVWDSVVNEVLGVEEGEVSGLEIRNVKSGELSRLDVQAMFVAIGHIPNTTVFQPWLKVKDDGYLELEKGTQTNIPGVYGAGDVADSEYRQAITAAGSGCAAALEAIRYLEKLD